LIDAFQILLQQNRPLHGKVLQGEWLDTGDKFNFIKATIKLGLKHPEVKEKLTKYLKELNIQ
jgi:UTP--glucose-1-phosphate uridylyltransferase